MGKTDGASVDSTDENKENQKQEENVENLRKVIKLNSNDEKPEENQHSEQPDTTDDGEENDDDLNDVNDLIEEEETTPANTREELEQKRAILQRIKDFDFQIKKNQEDINSIGEKISSLSKDLDDLVSLYEIVSEQMNPFVGLSKVTKKRLESLENINKEIENLKEKFASIEGDELIQTVKQDQPTGFDPDFGIDLSDQEMDCIIEQSFSELFDEPKLENTIDGVINAYIENLKDM